MRLLGSCNQIAQFYVHPFTVPGLPRSPRRKPTSTQFYEPFAPICRRTDWMP